MPVSNEKPLFWVGSSKNDLLALPIDIRKFFGHALDFAQHGEQHVSAKVLKGFAGAGVLEIIEDNVGGTYRAVYTVRFTEQCSFFIASRKRARAASPHRSRTWTPFAPG